MANRNEIMASPSAALYEPSIFDPVKMPKSCLDINFLDLPPEIREKIYIYLVSDNRSISLNFKSGLPSYDIGGDVPSLNSQRLGHRTFPSNLLLTNNQIYQEARHLYFSHNVFSIYVRRRSGNEEWDYFLSPEFLDNRRLVRSLQATFFRWGPGRFFLDVLCPALEDMILNGRLRDLEIRVRQSLVCGWTNSVRPQGVQSDNFFAIRRLLKDPYLERGVLLEADMDDWMTCDSDSFVESQYLHKKDSTSKLDELYPGMAAEQLWAERTVARRRALKSGNG